jgi:hypothetical protein
LATPEDAIQIPVGYVGLDSVEIKLANQFAIQQEEENSFILTMGQVVTPVLLGNADQRKEQAQQLSFVPIKVLGRFTLTRQRLDELIQVLSTVGKQAKAKEEKRISAR